MKNHIKPLIALVSGPILLSGLLCQTAQASLLNISGTSTLADSLGTSTPPEALTVNWSVVESVSDVYTYTYTINNPTGDVLLGGPYAGQSEIVDAFIVAFNTTVSGAIFSATGGTFSYSVSGSAWEWAFFTPTIAAGTSQTVSFQSDYAPTMGDGSASDANPPSPWNSSPDGNPVPVPNVPDSMNTMALLAGMLLLLPLRLPMKKPASVRL